MSEIPGMNDKVNISQSISDRKRDSVDSAGMSIGDYTELYLFQDTTSFNQIFQFKNVIESAWRRQSYRSGTSAIWLPDKLY